jgi:hypothetical protein
MAENPGFQAALFSNCQPNTRHVLSPCLDCCGPCGNRFLDVRLAVHNRHISTVAYHVFICHRTITVVNHCSSSIDPAFFPAANNGTLGGFVLAPGASQAVTLPDGYSGRAWGRTGCNSAGVCTTGSCTGGINCTAPAAAGPTLAQFTIDGYVMLKFPHLWGLTYP